MLTASIIVIFAQVLSQPEVGVKYLKILGITENLTAGRVVFYISIGVGLIYLIKNLISAVEVFFQNFSIQKMFYMFKRKMLYRYADVDYGFFLTRNSSFGMQVIGSDTLQMFSVGMMAIATILSEGAVFIGLVSMVVYMNPSVAFTVFCISVIITLTVIKLVLPRFYKFGVNIQQVAMFTHLNLHQFFGAFKEVVLLGKRKAFIEAYNKYSKKQSGLQAMQTVANAMPRLVIEVLFVGLFVLTIAMLCLDHKSPIQMIGTMGGYLYVGFRLMPGVNRLMMQLNSFKSAIPSIERVYEEYTVVTAGENYCDEPNFRFNDSIALKNASFSYINVEKHAISDVSFEIKKGESIGVIGETGSGKSTLIDLILGLLRPCEGAILVDGKYPVNSLQWHKLIGYVPQAVYLTDDTIESNIAFGDSDINELRLNSAIDAAQLRGLISKLPDGVKTLVGERGIRLSGGERQRISIARALYRQPEVLIFDEATSALDNETESKLMETIDMVSRERTVIMIAHRTTTLKNCDRIICMQNGKISRITTYEEL